MNKRKPVIAAVAVAAAISSFNVSQISAVSQKADIDPLIYEAVTQILPEWDYDGDGIISEEEFAKVRYIGLDNVTDDTDLTCLKKASSLRSLHINSSERTDYSDLAGLSSLRTLSFSFVPVSDLSFTDTLDLNYLMLTQTNVSNEEKLKHVTFPDIEIPEGYYDIFSLSPACALDCEFEIADENIAGFEQNAEKNSKEMYYNHIYAKSVGETEYSVILDGEVVAKRKIKVVPAEIYDPQSEADSPSVVKIQKSGWTDDMDYNVDFNILLSDGRVFNYQKGKYTLIAEDAADIYSKEYYSGTVINVPEGTREEGSRYYDNYILYKNGRLTLNGIDVFGEMLRVRSICDQYAITEDDDLWHIEYRADKVSAKKIGSGFSYLHDGYLAVKNDKSVVRLKTSKGENGETAFSVIKSGQFSVKSIIKSYNYYILETNGNFWSVDYSTGKSSLISKNVTEAGFSEENGHLRSDMIYIKDGKAYYTKTGSETTCAKDHIMHSEYDYEFNPYSDIIKTYKPLGFPENVTVNGVKNEKDDNFVAEAVSDMNGTMYFSCFEDHMAVTNVKSIVGTYYDGNDAIVHFIRDDDTLWEYCIGKREFRKADIPPYQSSENSSYSPADLVKAIKYFLGVSGGEATDLNGDGTVNISDLIYLKSLLVS